MLYECHTENNPYDNEQIKEDINELYRQMNGMPMREMEKIIYPVCTLCRDHEKVSESVHNYGASTRIGCSFLVPHNCK